MVTCPGGTDINGCPIPDTCLTTSSFGFGNDGKACPTACPVTCHKEQITCPSGKDSNDCSLSNTCVAKEGELKKQL